MAFDPRAEQTGRHQPRELIVVMISGGILQSAFSHQGLPVDLVVIDWDAEEYGPDEGESTVHFPDGTVAEVWEVDTHELNALSPSELAAVLSAVEYKVRNLNAKALELLEEGQKGETQ